MWNGELYGTFGPACHDAATITKMLEEGMTGMRLNLSHTSLLKSRPWIDALHEASRVTGRPAELLIDMQGPEIRIGHFDGTMDLQEGKTVSVRAGGEEGNGKRGKVKCSTDNGENRTADDDEKTGGEIEKRSDTSSFIRVEKAVFSYIKEGQTLLIDDGLIELTVEQVQEGTALCRIIRGGALSGGKSLKIVGTDVPRPALTASDRANISIAKDFGVTALMQPFVRSGEELREVRRALAESGNEEIRIFAKIENMEGIRSLDSILPEADMIVIARGDLGNDMPFYELPARQKEISRKCRAAGKPFLVVTQMLTHMIANPVPTRAEVSDIFNAVLDGADALMVTNETAVGSHPAEVLRVLKETADYAAFWRQAGQKH